MKKDRFNFWLWGILLVQTILVFVGFQNLVLDGETRLFMDSYDGMRNYFAYYEYIQQPPSEDYFLFDKMNYPFGDYIFYTDNTPLMAVPLKWFSENIYNVKDHSFQIYHWFFTFILVFTSLFVYLIGKEFIKTKWLLALFSIALPWLSPQILRLGYGHFGLALTICFLMVIYGLLKLHQNYDGSLRSIWKPVLGMVLTLIAFSFMHIYFLFIGGFMIGYFCLFWAIANWKNRSNFIKISALGLCTPLLALGGVFSILRSIDRYYPHRSTTANGFYSDIWQFKIEGLFTANSFLSIPGLSFPPSPLHYETVGYLGAFAIYGGLLFLLLFMLKKANRNILKSYFGTSKNGQFIALLFWAGIACLCISFGAYAHFINHQIQFDNWLNPLYWLADIVPQVTQFRCMARFSWVFFLTFNFFILYVLDQYFQRNSKHWWRISIVMVLPLLLSIDTFDTVKWMRFFGWPQPLKNETELAEFQKSLDSLDIEKYQAILPLPYYNSSCEDYNYTIDPEDNWCTSTYQISTLTDLPLMASRMGRTPLHQTYAQFDIFLKNKMPDLIADELTEQPILVIYNQNEVVWQVVPSPEPARTALLNGKDFPEKLGMTLLKEDGDLRYYEWEWWKNR